MNRAELRALVGRYGGVALDEAFYALLEVLTETRVLTDADVEALIDQAAMETPRVRI